MRDLLLLVGHAAVGAVGTGLLGAIALRALRRRSLALSLTVLPVVAVAAVLAGAACAASATLLPPRDLGVLILVCTTGGTVSLAVTRLLARQLVSAAKALVAATRTLSDGGGFLAPADAPTTELAELGREWAAAGARLSAAWEHERALETSRRELVAWISHDLRTPLAGMRAMAEALADGVADDPSAYHARLRVEVDRLSVMVGDLFELSRIQAGRLPLALTRISAYDLVGDVLAGAEMLAREHGVRLVGEVSDAMPLEVDRHEMTRALANLLVNAIHRTPADGTVIVAARREADRVVLAVTDGCGGIPAEDMPKVFDTGWRGTGALCPPGGAGLGLAIVRAITEAHSGRAAVHNVAGGCSFELVLPAACP